MATSLTVEKLSYVLDSKESAFLWNLTCQISEGGLLSILYVHNLWSTQHLLNPKSRFKNES